MAEQPDELDLREAGVKGGHGTGGEGPPETPRTILSRILRDARRAGLRTAQVVSGKKAWEGGKLPCLNTTTSHFMVSARHATKMAMLRRGGDKVSFPASCTEVLITTEA